ncbi:V-type ATPase [Nematocida parisii ERTm1]|uniref:V-type ATPase n=1 Tax=Nematocida parisii (strain ERTm3) TaxID=935791 RepID=I3EEA5_NEMP3|nr:V-type ATPase [Nematocida parisii ERTm1]EIJ87552.1 V-type ATPase [Nematocida parisii ERTm3]EIJ92779.1 V-type ATPase [Nematocida parisii ERTm1]KAI5141948.1 V-type H+-transporting ATPase subunit D [Nematocida parisii]|eukprot:XP_013060005.1 V-type ATPase [Nematocida parisii ERTm1]
MGAGEQRLAVFPTRMSLGQLQGRVQGAEKGKNLIKRRGDALQMKHREIASKLLQKKHELEKEIESAFFFLSRTEFYGGDMRLALQQAKSSPLSVQIGLEGLAGLIIPSYKIAEEITPMVFMGTSGKLLRDTRNQFIRCLSLLVEMGSLQVSFEMIDQMVLATNRRVNALEHVLIPKLENTISYVQSELDEQDREEFFRLKKVQTKRRSE